MWREDPISLAKKIAFRTRIPHVCCLCVFVNSAHRPLGLRCDPCYQRLTVVADTKLLYLAWAWGLSAKGEFQHSHTRPWFWSNVNYQCMYLGPKRPGCCPRVEWGMRSSPSRYPVIFIRHGFSPGSCSSRQSTLFFFSWPQRTDIRVHIYIEPWIRWYIPYRGEKHTQSCIASVIFMVRIMPYLYYMSERNRNADSFCSLVLAAFGTIGGALFGFDISSMSAWIGAEQYLEYFDHPDSDLQGGVRPNPIT